MRTRRAVITSATIAFCVCFTAFIERTGAAPPQRLAHFDLMSKLLKRARRALVECSRIRMAGVRVIGYDD